MPFRPDRPYNDLPPLPPRADLETREVLKACIEARAALSEIRVVGGLIPNQTILINAIPLLEAQASSEIENIVTTADRLFQFAHAPSNGADPATKETLRYRTALHRGFEALADHPLSTRTATDICRIIKNADIDVRKVPGTALLNEATGWVVYTPPDGEGRLRDMLANWECFVHGEEPIDPLVRMAVMHYQFEAIHPFTDGNGRTGRILNLLFLVERGLLDIPVLYLSRYVIAHKAAYYERLLAVTRDGDWTGFILFMLAAVRETSMWTTAKIKAIVALRDRTLARVRGERPSLPARALIDAIFVQPYCRIADLVEARVARRQAASTYLKALAALGLVEERKVGREKLFLNVALLAELTSADRA